MALEEMHAAILCGGLGTRLTAAVSALPKCLAPVNGRPFLEYLFFQLRSFGISSVILCVGHRSAQISSYCGSGARWNLALDYSYEREPLGTGGALKNAASHFPPGPFFAFNGDSLFDLDLAELFAAHLSTRANVTLALAAVPCATRFGAVTIDDRGAITAFREKSPATHPLADANGGNGHGADGHSGNGHRSLINAGVYVLDRGFLDEIPNSARLVSLEHEVFPRCIGCGLFGFVSNSYFIDIGTPGDYAKAQQELPWRFQQC